MPLILPGNVASAIGAGYEVANSCRFEDGDNPKLIRTQTAGDQRQGTFSAWIKKCSGPYLYLISWNTTTSGTSLGDWIRINDNCLDVIRYTGSVVYRVQTTRVLRDPAAWYHICVGYDSDQATASNRIKVYINGVQQTVLQTTSYPAENLDFNFNDADIVASVGKNYDTEAPFDGYMAEVVWIDGTQYAASDFGEFDSDSPTIWKPKDVSGLTFGTNGFYLDFEASGNLGNDANGGTDLTESGLAATDQATDTPTNNFCTISPVAHQTTVQVLSEGNLQGTKSGSGGVNAATIAPTGGKWYAEFFVNTYGSNGINAGVINVDSHARWNVASTALGDDEFSAGYYSTGILYRNSETNHTGNTNDDFDSYGADDIISIAMDLDNGFFYWAKNGTWQNSGDPTSAGTGTGGVATSYVTANETYVYAAWIRNGSVISWNFGNPPTTFSISSGNADANGYGNFEYAPPSGFYALCTKNLAEFGG